MDNFVHCDLHPGNILIQCRGPPAASGDGTSMSGELQGKTTLTDLWDTVVVSVRPDPCPFQLVLLDAGIVAQLSDHDLNNFKAVFTAVVLRQVREWAGSDFYIKCITVNLIKAINMYGILQMFFRVNEWQS